MIKGLNVFEQIQSFRHSVEFKFEEIINVFYYLLSDFIYSTRILCNFYIFIEYGQPEEKDEELKLLGTAVNGEIHILYRFWGKFTQ